MGGEFGSEAIQALLHRLFPALGPGAVEAAAYWSRRAVHFLAYLTLTAIMINALASGRSGQDARVRLAIGIAAVAIALSVAILDETLQASFPARMGRGRDVALDLAGITVGTMLRLRMLHKRTKVT